MIKTDLPWIRGKIYIQTSFTDFLLRIGHKTILTSVKVFSMYNKRNVKLHIDNIDILGLLKTVQSPTFMPNNDILVGEGEGEIIL